MITRTPALPKLKLDRDMLLLMVFSAALLVLRGLYLSIWTPYGLAPDEAQYWHWLSHPALAYVTKPALTTWAMGLSTALLGNTVLGVKLFALVGQVAVPLIAFAMVKLVTKDRALSWIAWLVLTTAPLVASGGLIMAPDALLLPLWLGAAYWMMREVQAKELDTRAWIGIGVVVGLAGLAKYSAGVFYVLLGLYALLHDRRILKSKAFYVSGLVALAMQAPTLIWNAQNNWEGLKHVLWQVDGGSDERHGGIASLLEFLGSQAGVWSLLAFGLAAFGVGRGAWKLKDLPKEAQVLFWLSVPIVLGFILQTFSAKVQANWPVLGVAGAVILGVMLLRPLPCRLTDGERYEKAPEALRKAGLRRLAWLVPGVVLGSVLSFALYDTPSLHKLGWLKIKQDPAKELLGYKELGYVTGLKLDTLQTPHVLLATRYQTAAALAFHTPQQPQTLYVNPGHRRSTEYDLWDWPSLKNTLVLYVNEQKELPPAIAERFNNCQPYGSVVIEVHGQRYRQAWYWVCWDDRFAEVTDK